MRHSSTDAAAPQPARSKICKSYSRTQATPLPGSLIADLYTAMAKISIICSVTISHIYFLPPNVGHTHPPSFSSFPISRFTLQACHRYSYLHSFHQKNLRASTTHPQHIKAHLSCLPALPHCPSPSPRPYCHSYATDGSPY